MAAVSDFLVFGHRGAMGHAPENTLLSVRIALGMGVDGVEIDVHLLGSKLIVLHDQELNRTTNGSGRIEEHSLEEIRRLDAGRGERIPLLEEVIEAVPRGVVLNVELKGAGTGCEVASLLGAYIEEKGWGSDRFLVSSFDATELFRFRDGAPGIRLGILATEALAEEDLEKAVDEGVWSLNLSVRAAARDVVGVAKGMGLEVLVYTVNSPDLADELKDMGVKGVFSDFPDRIINQRGQAG